MLIWDLLVELIIFLGGKIEQGRKMKNKSTAKGAMK